MFINQIRQGLKTALFEMLYLLALSHNKGIRAILLYHSVNDKSAFLRQMSYLKRNFRFVLIKDLQTEMLKAGQKENIVCCTFDDGELNNYTNALPILENLGLKATFFIATGFVGKYMRGPRGKRLMMNTQQLRELSSLGYEIGAHTVTHPILTEIPASEVRKEILQSKHYLEDLTGSSVLSFAYPFGDFDKPIRDLVEEAGFHYGLTIKEALLKEGEVDWFELPRIGIDETVNIIQFRGKVSPALELYEALRGRR